MVCLFISDKYFLSLLFVVYFLWSNSWTESPCSALVWFGVFLEEFKYCDLEIFPNSFDWVPELMLHWEGAGFNEWRVSSPSPLSGRICMESLLAAGCSSWKGCCLSGLLRFSISLWKASIQLWPWDNVYIVISKLLERASILSVLSPQWNLFLFTYVTISYSIFLKSNHFLAVVGS